MCFLSNIGNDGTVSNEYDSAFPNRRHYATASIASLAWNYSFPKLDYNKRSFDPCILVVLISIRLSPTVRIT